MNKFTTKNIALSVLSLAALSSGAFAGDEKSGKEVVKEAPAPSPIHLLANVEFSSSYVTPRGMIVRDQGLTIQPLLLAFIPAYKTDNFSVTVVAGMWNDTGTKAIPVHAGPGPNTHWSEIDPIAGLSFGLGKEFTLDVTYTAFVEKILDIGTSEHLETKLSFNDSAYLKAFALHPYVSFWYELDNKATDADVPQAVFGPSASSGKHPQPGSSYYFDIGIDPSYTFASLGGLTLDAPMRVQLPSDRFYGEYYTSASTVSIYELGLKATVPLNFMPQPGHWSAHVGVKYMNFVDDNLKNLQTFNAPGKPKSDIFQVYGGISVFF